ncbi:MAG: hypothetical protein ABJP45_15205 [Cyclobacteriaceae bacterium]
MKKWIVITCITIAIQSCSNSDDDQPVVCTEEFRTVGVTVTGGQFDNFYTVRKTTNDTIRHNPIIGGTLADFYPILDDNYQAQLANSEDTFTFHGFLANQLLLKEDYIIKADQCHIELVSGQTEIEL